MSKLHPWCEWFPPNAAIERWPGSKPWTLAACTSGVCCHCFPRFLSPWGFSLHFSQHVVFWVGRGWCWLGGAFNLCLSLSVLLSRPFITCLLFSLTTSLRLHTSTHTRTHTPTNTLLRPTPTHRRIYLSIKLFIFFSTNEQKTFLGKICSMVWKSWSLVDTATYQWQRSDIYKVCTIFTLLLITA